jgi:outer membrane protein OmpA-like peptidoglycan-associated protein
MPQTSLLLSTHVSYLTAKLRRNTMKRHISAWVVYANSILLLCGAGAFAQDGKLTIHVTPQQAYVFVDGHAVGQASKHHSVKLSAGQHKVVLANYGYSSASNDVRITAGESTGLDVTLQPVTGTVTGPFGAITIEGASLDAVLLNGKTPDYFVGHGDEFNHDWWWKQELIVPPATHQVTVLGANGEVWSGPVEVPANQRVVLDVPKGVRKTVAWPRGEKLTSMPRFTVGTASATVAVAKPTAELETTAAQINCGDGSQLKWSSTDAANTEINPVGTVASSGEQSIHPTQTTTYELRASGPGGTASSTTTVNVNTAVQADLRLAPAEVHYRREGDKVVQETSTELNWTATNASAVSIDPIGSVDSTGKRTLQLAPQKADAGPVDESVTYTLKASNACGGVDTKTATLHITGMIEPPDNGLALNSVYFPTDLPGVTNLEAGLVSSQQTTLKLVADLFRDYLSRKPEAHLILMGYADERGPDQYNQSLSERRADVAKTFLAEQGVPADHLDTQAFGKQKNLNDEQVEALLEQNSSLSEEDRRRVSQRMQTIVLANNRRVDIVLSTTGKESAQQYPFGVADYAVLVDRNRPGSETEDNANKLQSAAEKAKMSK